MITKPAPYYNNPQLAIKLNSCPHKMFIGGRGVGKTTIITEEFIKYLTHMPRGKIAFGGLTYFHIRTKSMPSIIDFFEQRGMYRNVHYFIGHKAPKKFGWAEPYLPPLDFSNCIHFANGFVIEFISWDRPEMARSGSYDGMMFDEAAKLKKDALDSDVLPANRGNKNRFGHIRFHHGTFFCTTMPITPEGEWVFQYQELMKEDPYNYLYMEASAKQNIKILGEKYFRDLKRSLPEIIYDIEIENKRPDFNVTSFYPKLSDKNLYYDSYNYNFIDSLNYDIIKRGSFDSRCDADCNPDLPLDLSWDFGSRINCCVVLQSHPGEYRLVKNFYRENDIYQSVAKDFLEYYEHHRKREVYLYGGSDGMKRNPNSNRTYLEDIIEILTKAKPSWKVYNMAKLHEIDHMDKFRFFNILLLGNNYNLPVFKINQNNAYETYFSMKNAPVKPDEIKKDKKSERDLNLPQWKATHLSDAIDNVVYWKLSPLIESHSPSWDMQILG